MVDSGNAKYPNPERASFMENGAIVHSSVLLFQISIEFKYPADGPDGLYPPKANILGKRPPPM